MTEQSPRGTTERGAIPRGGTEGPTGPTWWRQPAAATNNPADADANAKTARHLAESITL